jgi:hypothetical protein
VVATVAVFLEEAIFLPSKPKTVFAVGLRATGNSRKNKGDKPARKTMKTLAMEREYRRLKRGEIIQEGDEVDSCVDAWRDEAVWKLADNVGEPAPDPQYPSHRQYRRRLSL